jgi:hypothetical protein
VESELGQTERMKDENVLARRAARLVLKFTFLRALRSEEARPLSSLSDFSWSGRK